MNQRLGMNIYILRKSQGMTQDDLAEILNVSKMAVSKWERGLNFPDIEVMCGIADYFNVSVDEFRMYIMGEEIENLALDYEEIAKRKCKVELLEGIFDIEKEIIRKCLRNIDNVTLSMALSGASGEVCVYILDFLNVKLRKCIYEDVCMYDEVSLEHIHNAQLQMKKLLDCFVV